MIPGRQAAMLVLRTVATSWLALVVAGSAPAASRPNIVYILCERHFHVSGVIAVVTAGMVVSALGRRRLDPDNHEFLRDVWAQLGFWASSLVFVLASILVPRLMLGMQPFDLLLIGVVALGALVARAAVLFGLLPLLSAARLTQDVSHRYKFVILWGGLRGAVTLALALAVTENRAIEPEIQRFTAIHRADLAANVTPFAEATRERIAAITQALVARGDLPAVAQTKAIGFLNGIVTREAMMLSFEQLFLLFGAAFVLSLPLLLLMHRTKGLAGGGGGTAAH